MSIGYTVPAGLRQLLDDIIYAVLDDVTSNGTRLETNQQIYRLIADVLDTRLDQRQRDPDQPTEKSTKNKQSEGSKNKERSEVLK